MTRLRGFLSIFFITLVCISSNASAAINAYVSFTNIPPAREVIVVPRGYARCHIVPATYHHGYWVNAHRICQYDRGRWIAPHWECLRFDRMEGICMRWNWVPGYWEPRHHGYY